MPDQVKSLMVLDVRAVRRGHIPSAVNIDWENNIENGHF